MAKPKKPLVRVFSFKDVKLWRAMRLQATFTDGYTMPGNTDLQLYNMEEEEIWITEKPDRFLQEHATDIGDCWGDWWWADYGRRIIYRGKFHFPKGTGRNEESGPTAYRCDYAECYRTQFAFQQAIRKCRRYPFYKEDY